MTPRGNMPFQISRLQALAATASQSRMSTASRQRVMNTMEARRDAGFDQGRLAWGQALAAAAILVVLALPAALFQSQAVPTRDTSRDINLQARLQDDGSLLLEWENGSSVHTIRKAGSTSELAKVNGIRVAGERFLEGQDGAASPVGEIVYYQVD